jgi:hypothetical protein
MLKLTVHECDCCRGRVSSTLLPGRAPPRARDCGAWCALCGGSCTGMARLSAILDLPPAAPSSR